MQTDYFAPCWHRWDRANEHRTTLVDIWNGYIDEHPFDFSLVHEGDGIHVLQVWQIATMPPEFAVVIGEWLYNLRSSLDYVIWATAVHSSGEVPPPNEQRLQFPIYDSEQAWCANLSRLDPLEEHHVAMLRSMQPFASNADANYLGWINRLARIDRHRRLVDGTAYVAELEPVVQVPEGCSVSMEWGERVLRFGRADVARLTVSPWVDGVSVEINPRSGIDPEIGQWSASPFWGPMRFFGSPANDPAVCRRRGRCLRVRLHGPQSQVRDADRHIQGRGRCTAEAHRRAPREASCHLEGSRYWTPQHGRPVRRPRLPDRFAVPTADR